MSKEESLLADLLKQAESLPPRNAYALDLLRRRTSMAIRRVFGDSSHYINHLNSIKFLVNMKYASAALKNQAWTRGQSSITNLIRTMLEEWSLFESAPVPVLTIKDPELHQRTADLLSARGNYDRVLREATTILEDRFRGKVPFDDLAKIIPNASDQSGDSLVNKLMSPSDPIIVVGDRHEQTRLFRMMGGAIAYLRNPSHHSVNDNIEWSWAWSAVGLIDQLLGDIESATYHRPNDL